MNFDPALITESFDMLRAQFDVVAIGQTIAPANKSRVSVIFTLNQSGAVGTVTAVIAPTLPTGTNGLLTLTTGAPVAIVRFADWGPICGGVWVLNLITAGAVIGVFQLIFRPQRQSES